MSPVRTCCFMASLAASCLLAGGRSEAAEEQPQLTPQERQQLAMLTDGKGHYLAVLPLQSDARHLVFYSADGKLFYEQRLTSSGGEVGKRFNYMFVDPR